MENYYGFLGAFPSLQCAAEINHSVRRKTKLSESDGDTLLTVFKKNHQKLSRVDHRSIFHGGATLFCASQPRKIAVCLASFQYANETIKISRRKQFMLLC